jgi:hypothetical protein
VPAKLGPRQEPDPDAAARNARFVRVKLRNLSVPLARAAEQQAREVERCPRCSRPLRRAARLR